MDCGGPFLYNIVRTLAFTQSKMDDHWWIADKIVTFDIFFNMLTLADVLQIHKRKQEDQLGDFQNNQVDRSSEFEGR